MKLAVTSLAALLLLWGCGSSEQSSSPLQKYDKMRRELDWITRASDRVAVDAQMLQVAMARAHVTAVRADAVRLKSDARLYSERAGAAGNATRALANQASSRQVRDYLLRVTDALSWEWVEGTALRFVADQAWADPLSQRGGAAYHLAKDVAWARHAAQEAVRAAAAAQTIRRAAKSQFRYSISTTAG
jgi:major membrane immunogen (membrane-anchored lipoprotein)